MTRTNTVTNVTAGKPAIEGAIFRAPLSVNPTIPTSADATLTNDFVPLGYVSEDGMTNSNSPDSDTIKAWGGDVVLTIQNEKTDEFELTLIEALNTEVLKVIYGSSHVSGTMATGLTVEATADEPEEGVWVIDMLLRGGVLKRIVIPDGKVSEMDDIEYTDEDPVGFGLTIQAMPDANGVTHYEYFKQPTTGTATIGE